MSEQGWKAFLASKDLTDWAVLHGGAVAFFRTISLVEAAQFAREVASISKPTTDSILLTVSSAGVSVRLTRDLWQLEVVHIDQARAISDAARRCNATPDRSVLREVQLAIASKAEAIDVEFWRTVLGYSAAADDNAVDPLAHGSTVWMQEIAPSKTLRHAMHIDVSVPADQVQQRLAAAIAAGGRVVDDSHAPAHWTLSDTAGNRVCICAWPDTVQS